MYPTIQKYEDGYMTPEEFKVNTDAYIKLLVHEISCVPDDVSVNSLKNAIKDRVAIGEVGDYTKFIIDSITDVEQKNPLWVRDPEMIKSVFRKINAENKALENDNVMVEQEPTTVKNNNKVKVNLEPEFSY